MCLCMSSLRAIPQFTTALQVVNPVGLQSQMFWELICQVPVLKVGVPDVGYEPLLLREKLQVLTSLPFVGCNARGGVYGEILSLPLLPTSVWFPFHLPDVTGLLY